MKIFLAPWFALEPRMKISVRLKFKRNEIECILSLNLISESLNLTLV